MLYLLERKNKAMAEKTNTPQPALLLIPDISGFTQFVNQVEMSHGQSIIQELLETLIDSNITGLQISEVEGDAILFYRLGNELPPEMIAAQCKKMFISFHQQIKKYEDARICDCGACVKATKLTLKIVIHQGTVSFFNLRGNDKLYGPDVIVAHRLLKNNIPEHEYMLATNNIPIEQVAVSGKEDHRWIQIIKGSCEYDLGRVDYVYSPFRALYNDIPEPAKPDVKLYRVKNPFRFETEINAPAELVYEALIDLPGRINFMEGVKEVNVHDERHNKINRIGTRHECIRENNSSDMITSHVKNGEEIFSFSETAANIPMSCDYILEKKGDKTKAIMLIHLKIPAIKMLMFTLFEKKKIAANLVATLENLKKYCEAKAKGVEAT